MMRRSLRELALLALAFLLVRADMQAMHRVDTGEPRYGGKRLSVWLEGLSSEDYATVDATRSALRRVDIRELTTLIRALKHQQEDIRRGAARLLGEIGPAAMPALKALIVQRRRWPKS